MSERITIGVLSDTHLPGLTADLLNACKKHFEDCRFLLHAGDVTGSQVLDELEAHGWEVAAVAGNMDFEPSILRLPRSRVIERGGVRIGVCHGSGPPAGIRRRVREAFGGDPPEVIVYGHTHQPDDTVEAGIRFLNPGSPTDSRSAPHRTMARLTIERGKVCFDVIRL
jgi:hypothetical protein